MENHHFFNGKSTINGHFQYVKLPEGTVLIYVDISLISDDWLIGTWVQNRSQSLSG